MNQNKCCEKCIQWNDGGYMWRCSNLNCPCHTKPQDDTLKKSNRCCDNGNFGDDHRCLKSPTTNPPEEWEKEFDKVFPSLNLDTIYPKNGKPYPDDFFFVKEDEKNLPILIKSFIRTLLKSHAQDIERRVVPEEIKSNGEISVPPENYRIGFNEAIKQIKENFNNLKN